MDDWKKRLNDINGRIFEVIRGLSDYPKIRTIFNSTKFPSGITTEAEYIKEGQKYFAVVGEKLVKEGYTSENTPVELVSLMTFLSKEFAGAADEEFIEKCIQPATADKQITFHDLAGQATLKKDLQIGYIYPIQYPKLFPEKSKGIMLYGVPGGGKSLSVKAASNSIHNSIFYAPKSGELLGKYLGDVEKKIDALFKCASQEARKKGSGFTSIIFLDEFDAIASSRSEDKNMARSVNALLQAMDGFGSQENVSVIAATNYPWVIDGAILRRFSSKIFVDLPDALAMEQMILESLGRAYSLPGTGKYDAIKPNGDFNYAVLETIKQFGGGCKMGKKVVTKGLTSYVTGGTEEAYQTHITKEFIHNTIRQQLLPNVDGIKMRKQIEADPSRFSPEPGKRYHFGYSGSDVVKMMSIAIQSAAFRALEGTFMLHTTGALAGYYVAEDPKNIKGDVYVLMERKGAKLIPTGLEKSAGKESPENKANMVLNFSICEKDIEDAINKYPSTIIPQDYMDLLRYYFHGKSPNDP